MKALLAFLIITACILSALAAVHVNLAIIAIIPVFLCVGVVFHAVLDHYED